MLFPVSPSHLSKARGSHGTRSSALVAAGAPPPGAEMSVTDPDGLRLPPGARSLVAMTLPPDVPEGDALAQAKSLPEDAEHG